MSAGDNARRGVPLTTGLAVVLGAVVAATLPFDALPWLRGPAPYPPEWQWDLRGGGAVHSSAGVACALSVVALLWLSTRPFARLHARAASRSLVGVAVLLSAAMQLALLTAEPAGALRTLIGRTLSRSITSYHAVAISAKARDPRAFLAGHAALLPELSGWAKHAATHPPGPVLYYRAAYALCESSPGFTDAALDLAGVPRRQFAPPATRSARASALLGALGLVLLCALTAWPIARLAEALGQEPLTAARAALLWALLPGPLLMVPQFDQALALPVALTALLLLQAFRTTGGRALTGALVAGLSGGVALFVSYGAAVFLAIGGAAALCAANPSKAWPGLRTVGTAALAAATAAGLAFVAPASLGHQPLRAVATALAIHREMFTAPRSYALWFFFNPLDLAIFLGLPVAVLATGRAIQAARLARSERRLPPAQRFTLTIAAGIATLLLAGITRGEVGRLWIPLMPLIVATVTAAEDTEPGALPLLGGVLALLTLMLHAYWMF